ncbi:MAG: hypothetical protein ACYC7E_22215 [Armatimonadota bacterium]
MEHLINLLSAVNGLGQLAVLVMGAVLTLIGAISTFRWGQTQQVQRAKVLAELVQHIAQMAVDATEQWAKKLQGKGLPVTPEAKKLHALDAALSLAPPHPGIESQLDLAIEQAVRLKNQFEDAAPFSAPPAGSPTT